MNNYILLLQILFKESKQVGALLLIVPILVYYFLLVPLLKKKVLVDIQNNKIRNLIFIALLLFPVGDHLVGYIVYKTLCYTNSGVYIYKTVTDEQEQRDYWIDTFNQYRPTPSKGERYGIEARNYLTKDLKYHKTIYINNCSSKRWKSYDCEKAEKYIQENGTKIYTYNNTILQRSQNNNSFIENSSLKVTRLINDDTFELENAYLNYCKTEYDTLSKTEPNYIKSCKNADNIIKKYNLQNVVQIPTKKYFLYSAVLDKKADTRVFLFPYIGKSYQKIYDIKSGEILAEYIGFSFRGGWYINFFNPYHPSALSRCGQKDLKDLYDLKDLIIPNPYKIKRKIANLEQKK